MKLSESLFLLKVLLWTLMKSFLTTTKTIFSTSRKSFRFTGVLRSQFFSVRLKFSFQQHLKNISCSSFYSGRLQKQFWQQNWKTFPWKFRKAVRFTELFLVQNFFTRVKRKIVWRQQLNISYLNPAKSRVFEFV